MAGIYTEAFAGIFFLIALILASELVIKKAIKLAKITGFSGSFIGLTIISIGTSLPELFTNLMASLGILTERISPTIGSGIALGTSVGSDIFQQTIILGFVAIFGGICLSTKFLHRDVVLMIATSVVLLFFALDGGLSRIEGGVLLFGYIVYLFLLYKEQKMHNMKHGKEINITKTLTYLFWIGIGILFMIIAAQEILIITENLVVTSGIGASLIGVFAVGVASALPEFTSALVALRRGHYGISLGTLIGSNITNPALAIGLGALISTYAIPQGILLLDMPAKILTGFVVYFFLRKLCMTRRQGFFMIVLYLVYLLLRTHFFPIDVF